MTSGDCNFQPKLHIWQPVLGFLVSDTLVRLIGCLQNEGPRKEVFTHFAIVVFRNPVFVVMRLVEPIKHEDMEGWTY